MPVFTCCFCTGVHFCLSAVTQLLVGVITGTLTHLGTGTQLHT